MENCADGPKTTLKMSGRVLVFPTCIVLFSRSYPFSVFVINYLKLFIDHFIIYANATGWSEITEIIVRGEAKDNYLICNCTSTDGIRVLYHA